MYEGKAENNCEDLIFLAKAWKCSYTEKVKFIIKQGKVMHSQR